MGAAPRHTHPNRLLGNVPLYTRFWLVPVQIQAGVGAGHVGVLPLKEVLLTPTHTALVLDYAAGGTVFDRLASQRAAQQQAQQPQQLCMPEGSARFLFRQLASTVAFLHSNHIAHRCAESCDPVLAVYVSWLLQRHTLRATKQRVGDDVSGCSDAFHAPICCATGILN